MADRKKSILLVSLIVFASVIAGLTLTSIVATGLQSRNFTGISSGTWPTIMGFGKVSEPPGNLTKFTCRARIGLGRYIEVSEEFKTKVIKIAEMDEDVQKLLSEGYTVVDVRPIIGVRVEANGEVITKATAAVVTLKKNMSGLAQVWVNLTDSRVVRIVISTRTVIEKT